ncbi:MAG: hypothetical protein ACRD63_14380, partial [Pyrinomonadaceae bacterium]
VNNDTTVLSNNRYVLGQDLQLPAIFQTSLGVEQGLATGQTINAKYTFQRGNHLLRAHNINAPFPGVGRPDPTTGNVNQIESTANLTLHSLNINLTSRFAKRFFYTAGYILSNQTTESDGAFSLPSDNFNLTAERGPGELDIRHRLFAYLSINLLSGFRTGINIQYSSAAPYNITTGFDDNGDTTINDRPVGVTRNSARGDSSFNTGIRLSWNKGFGEQKASATSQGPRIIKVSSNDVGALAGAIGQDNKLLNLGFYVDVNNIFNHTNFTDFSGVETSPFFGKPTAALPGRHVQIGMNLNF